ncbi:MAG: type II toxin-antitoxin system VapC family toxin [Chthoniobacterales bacterium]
MTEPPDVIVDTNVLLDVTEQDERCASWSTDQMERHATRLVVNSLIYTELCYEAGDADDVDFILLSLGLRYEELPRRALFLAAQAFRTYRQRGGTKSAPLSDFFIGAHAAASELPILTRDIARYRTYFPQVELICPQDLGIRSRVSSPFIPIKGLRV